MHTYICVYECVCVCVCVRACVRACVCVCVCVCDQRCLFNSYTYNILTVYILLLSIICCFMAVLQMSQMSLGSLYLALLVLMKGKLAMNHHMIG